MSVRLTKDMKETIARRAINQKFEPISKKLTEKESKIGMRLYNETFPKATRDLLAKLDEKWIETDRCLNFAVNGQQYAFKVDPAVPVPPNGRRYCQRLASLTTDTPTGAAAWDYMQELQKAKQDKADAERAIMALLDSVTTIKKLGEVWPEGKAFYSMYEAQVADTGLPAVQIENLNNILGLKSKAKVAA